MKSHLNLRISPNFFPPFLLISLIFFFFVFFGPPFFQTGGCSATAKGLKPGHLYQFEVTAINKEGMSEPVYTGDPILAENPYRECPTRQLSRKKNLSCKKKKNQEAMTSTFEAILGLAKMMLFKLLRLLFF